MVLLCPDVVYVITSNTKRKYLAPLGGDDPDHRIPNVQFLHRSEPDSLAQFEARLKHGGGGGGVLGVVAAAPYGKPVKAWLSAAGRAGLTTASTSLSELAVSKDAAELKNVKAAAGLAQKCVEHVRQGLRLLFARFLTRLDKLCQDEPTVQPL